MEFGSLILILHRRYNGHASQKEEEKNEKIARTRVIKSNEKNSMEWTDWANERTAHIK